MQDAIQNVNQNGNENRGFQGGIQELRLINNLGYSHVKSLFWPILSSLGPKP